MTPPLTYAEFLAVFVAVPIAALGVVQWRHGIRGARRRPAVVGVGVILLLALSYTIPWDNYLISRGVWSYPEGTVLVRVGHMPVEEYAFVVLQSVLTALWLYRRPLPSPESGAEPAREAFDTRYGSGTRPDGGRVRAPLTLPGLRAFPGPRARIVGTAFWLGTGAVGAALLVGWTATFYMGAILAWAAPGIAVQWATGGGYLWRARRRLGLAVVVPTVYLCLIDRLAVEWGLWQFSTTQLTGWTVLGLPVEEATFFLLTNALVVHGLLLFHPFVEGWRGFGLAEDATGDHDAADGTAGDRRRTDDPA
jgi:lycopene cyclase domain-containing protein